MAKDAEELRRLLERILDAVHRGELTADTPRAIALLRRLEGARAALEELARKTPAARGRANLSRGRGTSGSPSRDGRRGKK